MVLGSFLSLGLQVTCPKTYVYHVRDVNDITEVKI